jgi:hypothetical protein
MNQPKRPPLKLIGVTEDKRPPLNLITDLANIEKKSEVQPVLPTGTQPSKRGFEPFLPQVPTKAPSVLTPKGQVDYQEQVKDFKPVVQKQPPLPKAEKPLSNLESIKNTVYNVANSLKGVLPRLSLTSVDVFEKVIGKDLTGRLASLPRIEFSNDGVDIVTGRTPEQIRNESIQSLDYLNTQVAPTAGIVENVRNFNIPGLAAGVIDAAGGLVSTIIPSALSGGSLLVTEMVGGGLYDYNTEKAKSKGVSTEDLYKSGDADFGVPAAIGGVAYSMERIGLKGFTNAISKKLAGSGFKKALLLGTEWNKEGLTEWVQVGLDEANLALANGLSVEDAAIAAADKMSSVEGLEAYAKGFAGSAAASGTARVVKRLVSPKNKTKASELEQQKNQSLQDLANENIPIEAKNAILDVLENTNEQIDDLVNIDRKEVEQLSESQAGRVGEINEKIENIDLAINDANISESTKTILEKQRQELDSELDAIIAAPEIKLAKPTFDTEEQLTEEIRAAEKEFNETGDSAEYELKINDLNTRLENLVPVPEEAKLETPKPQEDAVPQSISSQVPVLTEAPVSEEVEQGKPEAEPKVVTEEGVKAEEVNKKDKVVLSDIQNKAYEKLSEADKNLVDELIYDENYERSIGAKDVLDEEGLDLEDEINKSAISFEDSLNKYLNIPQPKVKVSAENEVFTFGKNKYDINKANEIISKESLESVNVPVDVLPKMSYSFISIDENTVNNADITKPVIIAKTKDGLLLIDGHHRVRKAIIENKPIKAFVLNETQTNQITGQSLTTQEQTPAQEVKRLRAKEQAELKAAIPNADQYLTDGKVDRAKITDAKDLKKFDKIWKKYDKLITPLLPKKEASAPKQEAPAVEALRDVESTAKALEGKDIESIIKPKSTKIVDADGQPLKLYHVSENEIKGDIRTVNDNVLSWHEKRPENDKKLYQTDKDGNYTEIGFHLGGEGTIKDFTERYGITPKTKLSVFLDINNLVEIKDLAAWTPTNIIKELDNMGYDVGKLKDKYTASEALEILKNLGIDGFKYKNIYEYSGEKYSYMAIHPEQVIVIDNNKVSEAYHKAKADGSNPKLVKAVEDLLSPQKEVKVQEAPAKAEPKLKPRVETRIKFAKAIELFNDISATKGGAKKSRLASDRRRLMEQNPSIKYIDDNWRKISDQLKAKGLIETKGNCP